MPAVTEAAQTGKVEQWQEFLAVIESVSTPYSSKLRKLKKPGGVEVNWQVKKYEDVGHRGVLDNKPATEFQSNSRTTLKCVSQKVWHNPAISDFANEQDIHGAADEWADQVTSGMVQIKRKIERRCLSNEDCKRQGNTGATAGVPNETRGAFQFFNTTQTNATYAIDPAFVTPAAQIYSGALAGFTENLFCDTMCPASFIQRKGPHHLDGYVGIYLKRAFSKFANFTENVAAKTPTRMFEQQADSKELVNTIDRLVLDTGTVDLMPSSFLWTDPDTGAYTDYSHRSGFFCDMEMGGLAFTRMPRLFPLAEDGSGKKAIIDAIFYHLFENPLGAMCVRSNADV